MRSLQRYESDLAAEVLPLPSQSAPVPQHGPCLLVRSSRWQVSAEWGAGLQRGARGVHSVGSVLTPDPSPLPKTGSLPKSLPSSVLCLGSTKPPSRCPRILLRACLIWKCGSSLNSPNFCLWKTGLLSRKEREEERLKVEIPAWMAP